MSTIIAAVLWWGCISFAMRAWEQWDINKALQRARTRGKKVSSDLGHAEWAKWKEIRDAGHTKPDGIFVGTLDRAGKQELFYNGEGSMFVIGAPGQGKTVSCIAQQLLRLEKSSSAVVLDTKLELWPCFAKDLERRGFTVKLVCPWYEEFNADFRGAVTAHDDGLDPLMILNDFKRSGIIDDVRFIATQLVGEVSGKEDATAKFFRLFTLDLLTAFILWLLVRNNGRVTLPDLRRALMAGNEELINAIKEMCESTAFSGTLAEYGNRIAGSYVRAPKTFDGALAECHNALALYDKHSPLAKSVSEAATTDPRTVKDRPTVIFFAIPADKLATHAAWLGLCISTTMEMIARDRRKKRVLALLDEVQQLPPEIGANILRGVSLHRGVGIQYILIFQFLAAAERLLGPTWREILGTGVLALYGPTNDMQTLELFSKLLGETTIKSRSYTSKPQDITGQTLGLDLGASDKSRALLTPSEIRMLPNGRQLLFIEGLKPIYAWKQSYLTVPSLRRRSSKNPYYRN